MNSRDGVGLAAVAVVLWLLTRPRVAVPDAGQVLQPSVTFPPVVPIGGGQVAEPERSGVFGFLMRGVGYMNNAVRGLRNNNPLNIAEGEGDRTQWVGESAADNDKTYEVFEHVKYGIRAAGRVLDSYQRQGFRTVRQIISRWAPSHENDTESYIRHVVQQTGWGAEYVPSRADFARLVAAMLRHENGVNPYTLTELTDWLNLP